MKSKSDEDRIKFLENEIDNLSYFVSKHGLESSRESIESYGEILRRLRSELAGLLVAKMLSLSIEKVIRIWRTI